MSNQPITFPVGNHLMILIASVADPLAATYQDLLVAAHKLAQLRGVDVEAALMEQLTAVYAMSLAVNGAKLAEGNVSSAALVMFGRFLGYLARIALTADASEDDVRSTFLSAMVEAGLLKLPEPEPTPNLQA